MTHAGTRLATEAISQGPGLGSDRDKAFFEQLEQVSINWGDRQMLAPVFYYDVMTLSLQFLAPVDRVRELLPSRRMHPVRVTPNQCLVSLAAFEYRDCDLDPYNEISVGIPMMLDKPSSPFTGLLKPTPVEPWVYIRHLPVNTQEAQDAGIEFAGFAKSLGDIEFERDGGWVAAHLHQEGRQVLSLACRDGDTTDEGRTRMHAINVRDDRMLRCETILSERPQFVTQKRADATLELGQHTIADELRALGLGRLLSCQLAPKHQAILTPALESLPV